MVQAFIGVGSNIEPEQNVREAIRRLAQRTRLMNLSTVYLTEPEQKRGEVPFYNCVVEIATNILPQELKYDVLRPIEESLGRKRTADKYASRTIDLDLIIYDNAVVETDALALPDRQILNRSFLAIPLCELAPELILPGSGVPVAEIAARLSNSGMKPLTEYTELLRKEFCHGDGLSEGRRPD